MSIIGIDRSIIPACDLGEDHYRRLVQATHDLDRVGEYKIGAALGLSVGLRRVVEIAREYTTKPLIYDHQKAGTDIPDTAAEFVSALRTCGVDAVIAFPLSGPETEHAFISECRDANLPVIIGAHMTHARYLASQGGWIADDAVESIFKNAAAEGVSDYVLPGNRPETIKHLRSILESDVKNPVFYAPGFVKQGGTISEAALAAGERWHAIVGRAIYEASDMRLAAQTLSSQI